MGDLGVITDLEDTTDRRTGAARIMDRRLITGHPRITGHMEEGLVVLVDATYPVLYCDDISFWTI